MKYIHTKTDLPIEDQYPKLVRDKIPEIVEEKTGKEVKTRVMEDDEEYREYLLRKVVEEASELEGTKTKEHRAEEIADIMELIDTILVLDDLDLETIYKIQTRKREERGGFKKRILMLEKVEKDDSSQSEAKEAKDGAKK